jgi:signal transduction histidine kinase/CheY-like chemotaxis protein
MLVRCDDQRIVEINEAALSWLGRARTEMLAASFESLAIYNEPVRDDHVAGVETRVRTKTGERDVICWIETFDVAGVAHRLHVLEDITERIALEEQLRQAQKLESLGLLAGGVAHDFNNLLSVIMTCSSLLVDAIPAGHPDRPLVDDIDRAVGRATGLTRQLLAFSRRQVTEPQVLDLNACVNETRKMLRRMVGEDIILTTSLDPSLHAVHVDPGYLVQVIMNLAVNARDAMPRGGMLELATRNVTVDDAYVRRYPQLETGEFVLLLVKDTGCGMSAEVCARVFEPFFTTKAPGHGTGMGLAVVRGIVDQAGGHVAVTSEPGVGTTFEIYLPATNAPCDVRNPEAMRPAFGIETLLLVDDDDYVRRAAARALRTRGYTVLEASTGSAALEMIDHEPVSMLLTDVVMPGMDGRQLAEAAQVRRPELKVLYISGYADDAVVRHGVMAGEVDLLEKPFHLDTLATRVRRILDRAPVAQELS